MRVGSPPSATIASAVWTASSRTLSDMGTGLVAISGRPSIGAGAILDLRPAAGILRRVTAVNAAAATTILFGLYEGTNFDASNTGTNLVNWYTGFGHSAEGCAIKNSSAGALSVTYTGSD